MTFQPYPFEKLRTLLDSCSAVKEGLNLSIGEPAFESPQRVVQSLQEHAGLMRYYPTLEADLPKAQRQFVQQRFNITLQEEELIPTFGSREVLFNFVHFIFANRYCAKENPPTLAFPNPFYQIYEGAQIANHANAIYMPLCAQNDFKPQLSKADLEKVSMVILNSPNNPTGQILTKEELMEWVGLALQYNFILVNDECYSEIYSDSPPPSILEACIACGNTSFKNVFAINSISKRIAAPGLRSGFIAGDSSILAKYKVFRTYVGISMPLPIQRASVVAWQEDEYAEMIRHKFAKNLQIAQEIFTQERIFPYTFYLWLCVERANPSKQNGLSSDESFTRILYEQTGHKVLPGSYLGRNESGRGFVRIALTHEEQVMREVLQELKMSYDSFMSA